MMRLEKEIRDRDMRDLGGESEVICPDGGRIDRLTNEELIEYKRVTMWRHAIGQELAYHYFYPSRIMRIHLFGTKRELANNLENCNKVCKGLYIIVTSEVISEIQALEDDEAEIQEMKEKKVMLEAQRDFENLINNCGEKYTRKELSVMKLHPPRQSGISSRKTKEAVSIVSKRGSYECDNYDPKTGILRYQGEGKNKNQELKRGNLKLSNNIKSGNPVTVWYESNTKSKYVNLGKFTVKERKEEKSKGFNVFIFTLQKL